MGQVINMSEWRSKAQEEPQPPPTPPTLTESEAERCDLRRKLRYCLVRLWTLQEPDLTKNNRDLHVEWFRELVNWVYSDEEPHGKRGL